MNNLPTRTVETVLEELKEWAESGNPIQPTRWLEASSWLVAFMGTENDKLILLESEQASKYKDLIETYDTAAKAKIYLDALPITRDVKRQKGRIKQIDEMIKISKKWATLSADEMRGY